MDQILTSALHLVFCSIMLNSISKCINMTSIYWLLYWGIVTVYRGPEFLGFMGYSIQPHKFMFPHICVITCHTKQTGYPKNYRSSPWSIKNLIFLFYWPLYEFKWFINNICIKILNLSADKSGKLPWLDLENWKIMQPIIL